MDLPLSNGMFVSFDECDYPLVANFKWYAQKHRHTWYALANIQRNDGTKDRNGRSRKTTIKMHRLILGATPAQLVAHGDGNGLNNRRSNISVVTHAVNQRAQHFPRSKTGLMGVYRTAAGTFAAQVKLNGRSIQLGTFGTLKEAALARAKARAGA